ncbi:hypothetical protein [Bacillus cereus]|uniref:hypothetical protein n=1 Tax=Bacillus cereus TaxID=1396 RepID=UPI003D64FD73
MITNTASAFTYDSNPELVDSMKGYELSPANLARAEAIGALPLDNNQQSQSLVQVPQKVAKVKAGVKKAWNKLPNVIKKQVQFETVLKAIDKYYGNSKTVEELVYKSLRSVVPVSFLILLLRVLQNLLCLSFRLKSNKKIPTLYIEKY